MRALLPLAIPLLLGCRDKPRAAPERPIAIEDAGTDAEAAEASPLDELLDSSSDAPPLRGDVTIKVTKIEPSTAFGKGPLDVSDQRWRFARCYDAPGEVKLTVRVGEGGEPISATGATCVAEAAKRLAFPEPASGLAIVELTLKFTAK